eukprot:403342924
MNRVPLLLALAAMFMIGMTMAVQTKTDQAAPVAPQMLAQQDTSNFQDSQGRLNFNIIYNNFLQRILQYIKANGLYIGNWWLIREEGQVLVFRDYRAQRDSRYAMYRGKYVDL